MWVISRYDDVLAVERETGHLGLRACRLPN